MGPRWVGYALLEVADGNLAITKNFVRAEMNNDSAY